MANPSLPAMYAVGAMFPLRVPWSKIYRAFPELDVFSDEECERYVLQVRAQRKTAIWLLVGAVGAACAFFTLTHVLINVILPWMSVAPSTEFSVLWAGVGGVSSLCMGLLIARDAALIRAIRGRIDNARCTKCKHSLLGLPLLRPEQAAGVQLDNPAVRCPECGEVMFLRGMGLIEADLVPLGRRSPPDVAAHRL